ncbi:hypothetical protein [Celeribacter neptunius]|uniref:Uncharacterized protein n=1 Tax=Celeribacter neptunius TaxID=588602 RepID=A0A1I3PAR3_9RHOB|nr:hypothetical protein [Celeribacter neptunius]SFJ18595.1 hypothetical protein SAMN04487991_1616 [Celeribacter neptunius]
MIRKTCVALLALALGLGAQGALGAGAQSSDPALCPYRDGGVLFYDITGGPLRELPLMQIRATGEVIYRAMGDEQSATPVLKQAEIPRQEAETLLREGADVLAGALTEMPLPPATGVADTAISHMALRFPDCDMSLSVSGLAFRAARDKDNALLQALRAYELRLLALMNALRS